MKRIVSAILVLAMMATLFSVSVSALTNVNIENGTYVFYSKVGSNMVMDVYDASKKSGANVQLYKYNGTTAQQFKVEKSGSWYTITPVCSGLKVDVKGGEKADGTNVQQYTSNNTDSQKWKFYDAGNGYVYIMSKVSDKALDVSNGVAKNGTNIQIWSLNTKANAQKWKLVKVSSKEDEYFAKLEKMANGESYNGAYKVGIRYKGEYYTEQCKGFAKSVHKKLFGYNIGSTKKSPNNYLLNYSTSNTKLVGSLKSMSQNSVKNLFSEARAGDFVQMRRTHGGSHSAIVYSVSSSGVTWYEANTDGKNTITKKTYTWKALCSTNAAMAVYTAKKY